MRLWFLRVAEENISRELVERSRLVPILFKKLSVAECQAGMEYEEIAALVDCHYGDDSAAARGQYKGALYRFLTNAVEGDFVAVCINRNQNLLYGELLKGPLRLFPSLERENIKGRPTRWLTAKEKNAVEKLLPDSVRKYRGTICKGFEVCKGADDVELPEKDEEQRQEFFSSASANKSRQVRFIRVGADIGCGRRLSRIFPGNYYHFIPIPKHNDPEFCRFTYGDCEGATKFHSLLNLRKNDVLVFYAGFDPAGGSNQRRCVGIFAYLVIQEVFLFKKCKAVAIEFSQESRDASMIGIFGGKATKHIFQELLDKYETWNAHADRGENEGMELVICGDRNLSRLLCKVKVLSEADASTGKYLLDTAVAKKWGLKPGTDMTRCSVRTVAPERVDDVIEQLQELP